MKAQVKSSVVRNRSVVNLGFREVIFSVSQARRALPYVARIARDACEAYQHAHQCCKALQQNLSSWERTVFSERRDAALRRLNSAIDECNAVGADLVDVARGVVRFGAKHRGRKVSLVWRLEEPIPSAWESLRSAKD